MIPESLNIDPQFTNQIELHLISDRSRSIVMHNDLQAAIGSHFSKNIESETSIQIGTGIESICFTEEIFVGTGVISSAFAEEFYKRILSNIANPSNVNCAEIEFQR